MNPWHWADVDPDRAAVVMGSDGAVTTYGQLADRSRRFANVLRDAGLERGDHVALIMDNQPRFLEVVWAALDLGLYVTPVNLHLTPDELSYVIGDSEAKVVVTTASLAGTVEMVDWRALPNAPRRFIVDGSVSGFEDYEAALAASRNDPPANRSVGSLMMYTSGTSGRPKGVLRPLPDARPDDPATAGPSLGKRFGMDAHTVYLSPAPLYHAAPLGFTLEVHRLGGTVVVMERFDAKKALELIDAHRVTHSQWVPTMLSRMLALPDDVRLSFDLSSQIVALHAAAPCPVDVKRRMIEWWGPILVEYYSGTEGGGMTVITSEEWLEHPGSVGRSGNVRIIGEDGEVLPAREVGTVYFAAGSSEFVYKGDPNKTQANRLPGGLVTMGDCGYLDEDGWLYLADRKDFMIISGGVNIYPQEVEDVLILHDDIVDAAVFGVPNADFGEEVKAAVELRPGIVGDESLAESVIAFCRTKLASYKVPRSIDFVEQVPRSPSGKLLKRVLRDPYWKRDTGAAVQS
jgi:long-chain acyl-CoA synthetase